MSLINEALKKAQRQRLEQGTEAGATPATDTGGHVVRRGKGQSSNTVVLLGSGALVLVVLSVVFTVYLVNRPADTKRVAVATATSATTAATPVATPTAKSAATPAPSAPAAIETAPAIVVPKITPSITLPVTAPASTSESPAVAMAALPNSQSPAPTTPRTTAPTATTPPPATSTATPSTTTTTVATTTVNQLAAPIAPAAATPNATPANVAPTSAPATTLPPGAPDERVAAFVDSIRVTGIRSSGAESRVLMNERVYRVNDVVERNLGVRLVKAAADSLTFSDPRGVTYVKNF